jgi:hypothetical protein
MIRKIETAAGFPTTGRAGTPLTPTGAGYNFIREAHQVLQAARVQLAGGAEQLGLTRERKTALGRQPVDILQAATTENQRLRREIDRLRGVLRDHGIEPDDGTAQSA